ncbi:MAG: relaxase MobL [Clostridiales bacterium]|nr:relaxase MobL [Clostridiales bacterium]
MEYIGRRPGVVLNEGMKHGLFGVVDGMKAEEVSSIQKLSRHIEAKTQDGTIAYRAVISFTEADAMRLGYDDPEKWRELVRARLPDMCEKIGIPIQNLEYTAAIHRDKGHPHCHILFWDKAQDIKKEAFVHKKVSNAIRVGLIKHVFADEMSELQSIKNEARKAALGNAGGFFGSFIDAFAEITPREYAAAVERLKHEDDLADDRLIYSRFNTTDMRELAADLLNLAEKVPKTGRLYFKLMPPDVKDEIRAFLEKLLEKNADCDREFKKYVYAAMKLSTYYTDNAETHEKAGKTAYDDMMIRLGNAVLRAVKRLNQHEQSKGWAVKREIYRRQMIESLVSEIFGILARAASAEENKVQHAYKTGELSKQAKKELAMRLESNSGNDWDFDR